ncbi:MAG: hypothetical protein MKZ80_01950 [Candidatus Nitrosopelagicus sp.]|nr:hypothetical protein [Candidatus Nitrosopelagicus sp.]
MSQIRKKTNVLIIIVVLGVLAIVIGNISDWSDISYLDSAVILEHVELNAVFLESDNVIEVSFHDNTNNSKSAILEILGMDVTYHKEYKFNSDSSFVEKIPLEEIPKYGWKTIPVTLEIQHSEFGKIGLKTEIHEPEHPKPKIIVEEK